ncbi:MAG: carboxymuconolactone decarboxylase family protein [Gammaproteobacteria bacterium]|nr:carboxymuconolactone decarboxylase family protein [Gammaproteobacteria bacterium]
MRELVALGAAIGASCEPCFEFHYDKARKLGVSVEAMREAVRIGEAVKAASAKNIVGLADRTIGAHEPKPATGSCCGGDEAKPENTSTECC